MAEIAALAMQRRTKSVVSALQETCGAPLLRFQKWGLPDLSHVALSATVSEQVADCRIKRDARGRDHTDNVRH
jgi:hypothetical protein